MTYGGNNQQQYPQGQPYGQPMQQGFHQPGPPNQYQGPPPMQYQPPGHHPNQYQPQGQQVVYVQQPQPALVIQANFKPGGSIYFGNNSINTLCTNCNNQVLTNVHSSIPNETCCLI